MGTTKTPKRRGRPRNGSRTAKQNDINRLKLLTRKLLMTMNKAMENKKPPAFAAVEAWKDAHALVFGKAPLSDSLVTLSDLLLKLNDVDVSEGAENAPPLAGSDMALVEAFLRRIGEQHGAAAPPPPEEE